MQALAEGFMSPLVGRKGLMGYTAETVVAFGAGYIFGLTTALGIILVAVVVGGNMKGD